MVLKRRLEKLAASVMPGVRIGDSADIEKLKQVHEGKRIYGGRRGPGKS